MKRLVHLFLFVILLMNHNAFALSHSQIANNPRIIKFINTLVTQYNFPRYEVVHLLKQAEIKQDIIEKISKPYESKPWDVYQARFLTDTRIQQGDGAWKQNSETLEVLEKEFGVPIPILIGILGVETFYGSNLGSYRVINALTTLAFYYPPRQDFFYNEFINYFLLCRELHLNPHALRGSYAGAVGQGQFMPSSYREYAVDFDGDGTIDLIHSQTDAIASIANYLKEHGWRAEEPIALKIPMNQSILHRLEHVEDKTEKNIAAWRAMGIKIPATINDHLSAKLLKLHMAHDEEYWLIFNNFSVIMTYNRSPLYAMAVYQLARLVAQLHSNEEPPLGFT